MTPSIVQSTDGYWFRGLPMPPTSNNLFNNPAKGNTRRYPTKQYQQYKDDCRKWHLMVKHAMSRATIDIAGWVASGRQLSVARYYFFRKGRVFAKIRKYGKGVRTMDTSNRIKALDDAIASMMTIDDKHFFYGSAEKFELSSPHAPEYACVHVSPYIPRIPDFIANVEGNHSGTLCLTRKVGQGIDIGKGLIQVFLKETDLNKARITISAPKTVKIVRIEG